MTPVDSGVEPIIVEMTRNEALSQDLKTGDAVWLKHITGALAGRS